MAPPLPGRKGRAGREEWCTLAHGSTILLQEALIIFWCGVKRPGHDCKHSFGLVTGLPETACPAISRHLIDSGKPTSDQGIWWGRAISAFNDGWQVESISQALDIGLLLFACGSHFRPPHCWKHVYGPIWLRGASGKRRMKERNLTQKWGRREERWMCGIREKSQ